MKKIIYTTLLGLLISGFSCTTDDLEPTLAQIKNIDTSVNTDEDLEGLMRGILNRFSQSNYYGRNFIITDEVRGDNVFANGSSGRFQTEAGLTYIPDNGVGIWTRAYAVIASSNIIINADTENLEGDANAIKNIQGQAYFTRALAHFDLLRQYGQQYAGGGTLGVPYVTTFRGDDLIPARNTVAEVKEAIYNDLDQAYNLMSSSISADKQYPSKFAAKAIESRLALYFKEWSRASEAAQTVINSGQYTIASASSFVNSFAVDNASNSIFELAFSNIDNVGINGLGYIYRGNNYGDIEVLPLILDLYEDGDVRANVLGYEGAMLRNMGKYPELQGFDNIPLIRIEEIVLNNAEALFEQGQVAAAIAELNKITAARNASPYEGSITKADILNERRKELIFEGFRFFDLSRSGLPIPKVSPLQNIETTIPAGDFRYALPIPQAETDANSNIEQNQGY